jgi:hypothetical protein
LAAAPFLPADGFSTGFASGTSVGAAAVSGGGGAGLKVVCFVGGLTATGGFLAGGCGLGLGGAFGGVDDPGGQPPSGHCARASAEASAPYMSETARKILKLWLFRITKPLHKTNW